MTAYLILFFVVLALIVMDSFWFRPRFFYRHPHWKRFTERYGWDWHDGHGPGGPG